MPDKAGSPDISVLMAAHNNEKYLPLAIQSILDQSFRNIELIIVDDCSSDASPDILQRYAERDRRVSIIRNDENIGLSRSLNKGLEVARGKYIARMDDDDVALPGRFLLQLEYLQAHRLVLCGGWFRTIGRLRNRTFRYPVDDEDIRVYMLFQNPFMHPSVIMETRVLQELGGYSADYPYAEDYHLFARMSQKGRIGNVPAVVHRYRLHRNRVSDKYNATQVQSAHRVRSEYLAAAGFEPTAGELEAHLKVREPTIPETREMVRRIESWLIGLLEKYSGHAQRQIIGDQWVRVAVKSACYGQWMWRTFRDSPIQQYVRYRPHQLLEVYLLCLFRLRYRSPVFNLLEQFSLS
ncbi:MAG TPA: glycosyltransferase [Thiolapillus brandeum]|uniref:Glycosyltransferase n=1 Tax=Thiolapillus brandeum TaxID=1076588 RepID=A0A831WAL5_9GAMM|nr:glycosyltransferase [Thiolapillus brandeum]